MKSKAQQLDALKYFKKEIEIHRGCVESIKKQETLSNWDKNLIDAHKTNIRHMLYAMELILEK